MILLSCGNVMVSQYGARCNRKFVGGKEKNRRCALLSYSFIRKEPITMAVKVKTGGIVPVSGQYRPEGSKTEVTFVEGNRVPPVPTGATTFTLVDKTKHSGGSR